AVCEPARPCGILESDAEVAPSRDKCRDDCEYDPDDNYAKHGKGRLLPPDPGDEPDRISDPANDPEVNPGRHGQTCQCDADQRGDHGSEQEGHSDIEVARSHQAHDANLATSCERG